MLRILHLYPRELGINGDVGNVLALERRAHWRGIEAEVHNHGVGDPLPGEVDVIHIGSGPTAAQLAVHPDLLVIAPRLVEWAATGVPVIAVAAGWQLLGHELELADGTVLTGAGVLPSRARLVGGRAVGEVLGATAGGDVIAGYENHSAVTVLDDGALPLAFLTHGHGNGGVGGGAGPRTEGVLAGAHIGTNLHGPFLPMNPRFADDLLRSALERRGEAMDEPDARAELVDEAAAQARAAIAGRVG